MVASSTMPVSPIPPAVAQKSSGSSWGVTVIRPRAGVTMVMAVTASHHEPTR